MIDITLEFDGSAFDTVADTFVSEEALSAMRDAVNYTANRVYVRLREEMLSVFDKPTPFTLAGLRVYQARPQDAGEPTAMIFLMDQQAAYLSLEITGGTRRAGDYATTRLDPLLPGPAAVKDRFGNLPRNFVAGALQDRDVAWVTLRLGEPPALVRHTPGKPVEILATIVEEAHYVPRLDFYGVAVRAVGEAWPSAPFPVFD